MATSRASIPRGWRCPRSTGPAQWSGAKAMPSSRASRSSTFRECSLPMATSTGGAGAGSAAIRRSAAPSVPRAPTIACRRSCCGSTLPAVTSMAASTSPTRSPLAMPRRAASRFGSTLAWHARRPTLWPRPATTSPPWRRRMWGRSACWCCMSMSAAFTPSTASRSRRSRARRARPTAPSGSRSARMRGHTCRLSSTRSRGAFRRR